MLQKILIVWAGIIAGVFLAYFLVTRTNILNIGNKNSSITDVFKPPQKVVLGFLPFWLIDKAGSDYSKYITELSYFNLTIAGDGTIQKYTAPGESEPGYHTLTSGKVDDFLSFEKSKGVNLSLTIFSGDDDKINSFLNDPNQSAQNLITDISPIIQKYDFTDVNLDIEKVSEASPSARIAFTNFVQAIKQNLGKTITVTVDIPPIAFVKDANLADPKSLSQVADYIVLMDYDFHNPEVLQRLGQRLEAGPLSHVGCVSPERQLILLANNTHAFLLGWPPESEGAGWKKAANSSHHGNPEKILRRQSLHSTTARRHHHRGPAG